MKLASPHYARKSVLESDLDQRDAERDLYRNLLRAETAIKAGARKRAQGCNGESCRQGRRPCRENCHAAEMACTAGGPASVPVRRIRKPLPTLPWWRRWEMQWQRVCAGVKRA